MKPPTALRYAMIPNGSINNKHNSKHFGGYMSILFLNLIMIISLVSIVALAAVWVGEPKL